MDREVILKVDGDEVAIGFVSDFLLLRSDEDTSLAMSMFERICEAIGVLDLSGFETSPVVIEIS